MVAGTEVGGALVGLELDGDGMLDEWQDVQGKMERGIKNLAKSFDKVSKFGQKAFIGIGAAIGGTTAIALQFESQMGRVNTMLGPTSGAVLEEYKQGVIDLAMAVGENTEILSDGLYTALSNTISESEALGVLNVAARGAAGGFTETNLTLGAITKSMLAFKDLAPEEIMDDLAASVDRGSFTMGEFASVLPNTVNQADLLNISFKENAATLAFLSKKFASVSQAGTALEGLYRALLIPTPEVTKKLGELGTTIEEVQKKVGTEGLAGAVQFLIDKDMGRGLVRTLFRRAEANMAMNNMLKDMEGWAVDIDYVFNSAGLSEEKFRKRLELLSFQLKQVKEIGQAALRAIGEMFLSAAKDSGMLDAVKDILKDITETLMNLSPQTKKTIAIIAGLALAFTGLLAIVAPVAAVLGMIAAGPIMAVIGGIVGAGGLLAAVTLLRGSFENLANDAGRIDIAFQGNLKSFLDQQAGIETLIDKYELLKSELANIAPGTDEYTKKSKELQWVMEKLFEIVPEATAKFDDHGKVLEIDVQKVKNYTEAQRVLMAMEMEIMRVEAALTIAELENSVKSETARREDLSKRAQYQAERIRNLDERIANTEASRAEELRNLKKYHEDALAEEDKFRAEMILRRMEKADDKSFTAIIILKRARKALNEELNKSRKELLGLKKEVLLLNTAQAKLTMTTAEMEQLGKKRNETFEEWVERLKEAKPATKEATKAEEAHADAIQKTTDNLDIKKIKEFESQWKDFYKNLREFSDFTTEDVIADIDKQMTAEGLALEEYRALMRLRQEYTKEAAAKITKIWGQVTSDFKGELVDMLDAGMQGWDNLGDVVDGFADTMIGSIRRAFAESIVEKLGFDNIFKGNILGLENFMGGFGQSIVSTFSGIFSGIGSGISSIFGGTAAAAGSATALTNVGLGFGSIVAPANAMANATTLSAEAMATLNAHAANLPIITGNLTAAGTAAEGTAVALEGTATAAESAGAGLSAIVGPAIAALYAADALVGGIESLNSAFDDGGISARDFGVAYYDGVTRPLGRVIPGLDKMNDTMKGIIGGFMIAGPIGAVIGAFGGDIIKHGTSGMENLAEAMSKVVEQGDKFAQMSLQEFRQMTQGEMGRLAEVADAGSRGGGELTWVLEQGYAERQIWFDKYIVQSGAFNDKQLRQFQDMLGLYEEQHERKQAAENVAFENSLASMGHYVWEWAKLNRLQRDEIGGWEEAFKTASDNIKKNGGDFRVAFQAELEKLTDITDESMQALLNAFDQASGTFQESGLFTGGFELGTNDWREWTNEIKSALNDAKTSVGAFTKDVESVMDQWLSGEDFGLEEALLKIPGITEELARSFTEEAEALKEAGKLDFGFSDEFTKGLEAAKGDITFDARRGGGPMELGLLMGGPGRGEAFGEATAELGNFMARLRESGTALDEMSQIQVETLMDLLDAEDSRIGQDAILNGIVGEVIKGFFGLDGAVKLSEEDFEKLTIEQRAFLTELTGFSFDAYIDPILWHEFIKPTNLDNFVIGTNLNDHITGGGGRAGRGVNRVAGALGIGRNVSIGRIDMRIIVNGDIRTEADLDMLAERTKDKFRKKLMEVG